MTFYNVVSAVIFLGAFRELALAFDAMQWGRIWIAASIVAIVINDMVSFSHWVEGDAKVPYNWKLMLLDLLNFAFVGFSLLAMNPSESFLSTKLTGTLSAVPEYVIWLLLGLYWLCLMLWTKVALKAQTAKRVKFSLLVAVFFLAQFLLQKLGAPTAFVEYGRALAFFYLVGYIASRAFMSERA